MKTTLLYAGLFLASLLVASEIVLVLVPRGAGKEFPPAVIRANATRTPDSAVAQIRKISSGGDRLGAEQGKKGGDSLTTVGRDSLEENAGVPTGVLRDSVELLKTELAAEEKKVSALSNRIAADTAASDSAGNKEKKIVAKLLESMDAQGAAKILHGLDDKQVKEILFSVKKRQAGKILGSLDPERAARIIR